MLRTKVEDKTLQLIWCDGAWENWSDKEWSLKSDKEVAAAVASANGKLERSKQFSDGKGKGKTFAE